MPFKRLFEKGNGATPLVMGGSLLQKRGADGEKARSPMRVRVFGTKRQVTVEERRERADGLRTGRRVAIQ